MRYEIRYLPVACLDLDGIAEYLQRFYPDTAARVLHSIEEKLKALEQMPEMYEEYPKNPFYRRMVVEKYLVFYHVNRENGTVDVYRVLRAAWDIEKQIPDGFKM